MTVITDERCTAYSARGHPERPQRILGTLAKLRSQTDLSVTWEKPADVEEAVLLRVHPPEYLDMVRTLGRDFDGDTPWHDGIFDHARRGVGGALKALELARRGGGAFSLLRPPGHHATRTQAMGFCYLSTMAIAVFEALAKGSKRVAVLDFDVHHGNGTEEILAGRSDAFFASVHQHPCYPGTGTSDVGKNCFNYPVPPRFPRLEYRQVVLKALGRLMDQKPDLLGVSAGFDAYVRDPIAQETLEAEDFQEFGREIRRLGIPVFSVFEGGYSGDLPDLVLAYLRGLEGP